MPALVSLRRRRNGLFSVQSILLATISCLVLYTFLHLRKEKDNPLVDDQRDLRPKEHGANTSNGIAGGLGPARKGGVEKEDSEKSGEEGKGRQEPQEVLGTTQRIEKAMVVASQRSENTTWLHHFFPQWEKYIYHVDEPTADLTVPKNKGRESMVYLT
jgi:hypothetical protein